MAHPLLNIFFCDKIIKAFYNIPACLMSTSFFELENRAGICYSIKSAVKRDEKKEVTRFLPFFQNSIIPLFLVEKSTKPVVLRAIFIQCAIEIPRH